MDTSEASSQLKVAACFEWLNEEEEEEATVFTLAASRARFSPCESADHFAGSQEKQEEEEEVNLKQRECSPSKMKPSSDCRARARESASSLGEDVSVCMACFSPSGPVGSSRCGSQRSSRRKEPAKMEASGRKVMLPMLMLLWSLLLAFGRLAACLHNPQREPPWLQKAPLASGGFEGAGGDVGMLTPPEVAAQRHFLGEGDAVFGEQQSKVEEITISRKFSRQADLVDSVKEDASQVKGTSSESGEHNAHREARKLAGDDNPRMKMINEPPSGSPEAARTEERWRGIDIGQFVLEDVRAGPSRAAQNAKSTAAEPETMLPSDNPPAKVNVRAEPTKEARRKRGGDRSASGGGKVKRSPASSAEEEAWVETERPAGTGTGTGREQEGETNSETSTISIINSGRQDPIRAQAITGRSSEAEFEGAGKSSSTLKCRIEENLYLDFEDYKHYTCSGCYNLMPRSLFNVKLLYRRAGNKRRAWLQDNQRQIQSDERELIRSTFKDEQAFLKWDECCRRARECCLENANFLTTNRSLAEFKSESVLYDEWPRNKCHATWDGLSCWPDTPAGQLAAQDCPNHVYFFDFTPTCYGRVTKQCFSNGSWYIRSEHEWSDYSNCAVLTLYATRMVIGAAWHIVSAIVIGPALIVLERFPNRSGSKRVKILSNLLFWLLVNGLLAATQKMAIIGGVFNKAKPVGEPLPASRSATANPHNGSMQFHHDYNELNESASKASTLASSYYQQSIPPPSASLLAPRTRARAGNLELESKQQSRQVRQLRNSRSHLDFDSSRLSGAQDGVGQPWADGHRDRKRQHQTAQLDAWIQRFNSSQANFSGELLLLMKEAEEEEAEAEVEAHRGKKATGDKKRQQGRQPKASKSDYDNYSSNYKSHGVQGSSNRFLSLSSSNQTTTTQKPQPRGYSQGKAINGHYASDNSEEDGNYWGPTMTSLPAYKYHTISNTPLDSNLMSGQKLESQENGVTFQTTTTTISGDHLLPAQPGKPAETAGKVNKTFHYDRPYNNRISSALLSADEKEEDGEVYGEEQISGSYRCKRSIESAAAGATRQQSALIVLICWIFSLGIRITRQLGYAWMFTGAVYLCSVLHFAPAEPPALFIKWLMILTNGFPVVIGLVYIIARTIYDTSPLTLLVKLPYYYIIGDNETVQNLWATQLDCWLSDTKYSFIEEIADFPNLVLIILNGGLFVVTLIIMCRINRPGSTRPEMSLGDYFKAAGTLVVLYGAHYMLIVYRVQVEGCIKDQVIYYCFLFVDGIQGMAVSYVFCYRTPEGWKKRNRGRDFGPLGPNKRFNQSTRSNSSNCNGKGDMVTIELISVKDTPSGNKEF